MASARGPMSLCHSHSNAAWTPSLTQELPYVGGCGQKRNTHTNVFSSCSEGLKSSISSLDWNCSVTRADSFWRLRVSILTVPVCRVSCMPWLVAASAQSVIPYSPLSSYFLLLFCQDTCDYLQPTQIISHLKFLNLITLAKSILPEEATCTSSGEQDVDKFGAHYSAYHELTWSKLSCKVKALMMETKSLHADQGTKERSYSPRLSLSKAPCWPYHKCN